MGGWAEHPLAALLVQAACGAAVHLQPRPAAVDLRGGAWQAPDYECGRQPERAYDPIVISNPAGTLTATLMQYGGTIMNLVYGGGAHNHAPVDVLLGWESALEFCQNPEHGFFGSTIGRVSNRIPKGRVKVGDVTYELPTDGNGITLHGGTKGFDRYTFDLVRRTSSSVTFHYFSKSGEEGFPGNVNVQIEHTITPEDEWQINYTATSDADTVLALTMHPYFNLNGNVNNTATVLEHYVTIPAGDQYVEVDDMLVPTGSLRPVRDEPEMDFTAPKRLGRDIDKAKASPRGGYDHAFVFGDWKPGRAPDELPVAMTVHTPVTGIGMNIRTNQPSIQMYSGNFLNGTDPMTQIPRKKSQTFGDEPQYYQWRGALALEAQALPGSTAYSNFPSVKLGPGEVYRQFTSYQFFQAHAAP